MDEDGNPASLSIWAQLRVFTGLLAVPGFVHCLSVFTFAEATINAFSTFMDYQLKHVFMPDTIGMIGIWFILSGMLSSAVFSMIVDRTMWYKRVTLIVFCGAIVSLIVFSYLTAMPSAAAQFSEIDLDAAADMYDSAAVSTYSPTAIYIAVIAVGFWLGPLQPIAVEAAAECTYPLAEELSATMLQLTANFASAALVPLCLSLRGADGDMSKANWLVVILVVVVCAFFTTWYVFLIRSAIAPYILLIP